jgi:hypothetical protein
MRTFGSSVSIVTMGWMTRVKFPARAKRFSLSLHVQTGSGAHPASYPMNTGSFYPEVKRPGCEADHSPPYSAKVKKKWSYTFTNPQVFMAWCVVSTRDKFIFIFCINNHSLSMTKEM